MDSISLLNSLKSKVNSLIFIVRDFETVSESDVKKSLSYTEEIKSMESDIANEIEKTFLNIGPDMREKYLRKVVKELKILEDNCWSIVSLFYKEKKNKEYRNADLVMTCIYVYCDLIGKYIVENVEKLQELYGDCEKPENIEKLNWIGSPSQFGFIINELIDKGFIESPKTNGTESIAKLSRTCFNLFNINTSLGNLANELNPHKNSLSETNRKFFKIPNQSDL